MTTQGRPIRRMPRRARILLMLFVLPILVFSASTRSADEPRSAEPAISDEAVRTDEILLGRVSCDVRNGTLSEFLAQISKGAEAARIVLDEKPLRDDCGISADTEVTLQAQRIRRQSAMAIVLRPHGAGYYVKDGTIHVTSLLEVEASQVVTRHYYVADLESSRWGQAMGKKQGNAPLIELITTTIKPQTWRSGRDDWSIRESEDHRYLEVRNSEEVHDQLAQLLARLRESPATSADGKSLVGQIRTRHSFRFVATPLADAGRQLSAAYDVNLYLDEAGMQKHGISAKTPITWQAEDATLSQSLDRMLKPLSLTYVIENEAIKITSQRSGPIVTMTYAVHDLLRPVRRASGEIRDSDIATLMDRIKQQAAPGTWGDPGEIQPFPKNLSLVISHNSRGHEAVRSFLSELRKAALGASR